ncbi:MAG: DEAD/DEAH box helicase [Methanospirillum sp.]|uniref:DEAD/DEAH box helicase n=1 Tax=Methanospirillum sp. TaxID=45200 RepID=UPI00236D27A9|nr:DEAD/DEAH box helicase [Methanospirillum sp.]MDD1728199.1 DEAD/DEAH box helicase [Methanospirillum sp.]
MNFLHACYQPDSGQKLFIFGENPDYTQPKKRGRKPRVQGIQHPTALSSASVAELLEEMEPSLTIEPAVITLLLPVHEDRPLSSDDASDEPVPFSQVSIPAVSVGFQDLVLLFPALMGISPHTRCSDSLLFFRIAFEFSLELVSREQFFPASGGTSGEIGRWAGVIEGDDNARVRQLADVMPLICGSFPEGRQDALTLLTCFIHAAVDMLVTTSCAGLPSPLRGRAASLDNPAAAWYRALRGDSDARSAVSLSSPEFIETVQKVQTPLPQKSRSFFTCIRLTEPSDEIPEFSIGFHLQARDDPSLLISAAEIWKKRSVTFTYLNHRFEHPQEQLLADLFAVGKLFPPVSNSLKSRAPVGITLTSEEASSFLTVYAALIQQMGVSVLLPSWWKDATKKPVIRLLVSSRKRKGKQSNVRGFFSLSDILSYQWQIAIGDQIISAEEYETLSRLKKPLIHIGGKWAAFNAEELQKAVRAFQKQYPDGVIPAMDALRLGLAGENEDGDPVEIACNDEHSRNYLGLLLGSDPVSPSEIRVPASFRGTLRPYQVTGLSWLLSMTGRGLGVCLADDMGLGKTVQVLAYLLAMKGEKKDARTLLVAPMSLLGNWQREISRFSPSLKVHIHHGQGRLQGDEFANAAASHDIILTTYQMVQRDESLFVAHPWDVMVLDEAQNIKNNEARQTRVVKKIPSPVRIALTGTPVENRLMELWSIMDFVNPGYLGQPGTFVRNYATPIEKYHDRDAAEQLQKLVKPFVLRRVKTDKSIISDLPEKNIQKRYCTLTSEQATLYQATVDGMLKDVEGAEGIARRGIILTALLRLKQICNHPNAYLDDGKLTPDRSGKIAMLFTLLEEVLASDDAAILFTQFSAFGERLLGLMQCQFREDVLFLHGKTPRKQRDDLVRRFASPQGPRLFLLSLKAGGVGLNLTRANHVFHIDRWWNPAVEDQATDRAYRIGQQKNVAVHLLISAGTLEERIDMMIEEKRRIAESVIGTGEDWITSLSTDELRDLLRLSGELIGGE